MVWEVSWLGWQACKSCKVSAFWTLEDPHITSDPFSSWGLAFHGKNSPMPVRPELTLASTGSDFTGKNLPGGSPCG